jgi:hypothetical protein
MAITKKLKKAGVARWYLSAVQQNDSFSVPHGFRMRYLGVETVSTISATNITIGAVPGTYTTATFTVTSVAAATTGTLVWGGGATGGVTLAAGDILTVGAVAAKIAASAPTGGWVVTATGAVVSMIGVVPGVLTAPTIALDTASNITFGTVTTVAGAIDNSIVHATALSTSALGIAALTPEANKDYVADNSTESVTFTLNTSSPAAGTIQICGQSFNFTLGQLNTGTTLATQIGTLVIPGYTITPSSNTVKITVNANKVGTAIPTISLGTATGVTYAATTIVKADKTYYVNFTTTSAQGNTNLYVILEKIGY